MDTRISTKTSDDIDDATTNKYFTDEAKHLIDKIRKERTVIYQTESTESTPNCIVGARGADGPEPGVGLQ